MNRFHDQTKFTTLSGKKVQVDVGIVSVLEELKRLGVETFFSCEGVGNEENAYVLCNGFHILKLIRRINQWRSYSLYDSEFIFESYKLGYREIQLNHYRRVGKSDIKKIFETSFNLGYSDVPGFAIEFSYSLMLGFRCAIRWPSFMSKDIYRLLRVTPAHRKPNK